MRAIYNLQFTIYNFRRREGGFTLIELLIAIAIISILASFLMANFVGVRQRARDGTRKSDLRQIQSALEIYRSDKGNYPNPSMAPCNSSLTDGTNIYMQKIPCDPLNTSKHIYTYSSTGTTYSLYSCLENVNDSQKDTSNNGIYCDGGSTNWSYTLQNP